MVRDASMPKESIHRLTAFGRVAILLGFPAGICALIAFVLFISSRNGLHSGRLAGQEFFAFALVIGVPAVLSAFVWANTGYLLSAAEIELKRFCLGPISISRDAVIDVRETRCGVYLTSILGNRLWVPKDLPGFKELLEQACAAIDRNGETFAAWRRDSLYGGS